MYIVILEAQSTIGQMVSLYNTKAFDLLKAGIFTEILSLLCQLPNTLVPAFPPGLIAWRDKTQTQIQDRMGEKTVAIVS